MDEDDDKYFEEYVVEESEESESNENVIGPTPKVSREPI